MKGGRQSLQTAPAILTLTGGQTFLWTDLAVNLNPTTAAIAKSVIRVHSTTAVDRMDRRCGSGGQG
ncbi:MAG TPA: hypothetical protein VF219_16635, partial [Vicinamibacterales bacterium]